MEQPRKHVTLISCLLLVVVTCVVYSAVRSHPFVDYDDQDYVTQNTHVQAGLNWKTFTWALTATEADNWHPLTWLSHALDCQLYGLNPAGHHITNLILHVLNVLLLFLLLKHATGAAGRSLLVAALFALHPFNVESVAWVAERKNLLSTLFFLLAIGAYGWYAVKPGVKRYLLLVLLFAFGLAAKPMVITLPFVLLLLDYWPLKRFEAAHQTSVSKEARVRKSRAKPLAPAVGLPVRASSLSHLVIEKLPLLIFCAGSAYITIIAQSASGAVRSLQRFSFANRLENAGVAYAAYLGKAFWPRSFGIFYPHAQPELWQVALSLLVLLTISIFVWKQRKTHRYLIVGWLWYLGTLVPVIGLVQVGDQAMADRYAYVPLIGIFVMFVWGVADLADRWHLKPQARFAASGIILAALSLLTWRQVGYWDSYYDVWAHTLAVTKNNLAAEEGMSKAMLMEGKVAEALPGLEKAAALNVADPMRHANLGAALYQLGRLPEAAKEFATAAEVAPTARVQSRSYESLATIYDELGDFAKVRESYEKALKADPEGGAEMVRRLNDDVASDPTAARYVQLGLLLEETGRANEARTAYRQALSLDPGLEAASQALSAMGSGK